jgi:hypothetical protein
MGIPDLSAAESSALQRILAYWLEAWDWECPTLFGLEREDLAKVLADWPNSLVEEGELAALAVFGALRESLYGASTIPTHKMESVCGLSQADLQALTERLGNRLRTDRP